MMVIQLKDAEDMNRYFFGPNADRDYIYKHIHQAVEKGIMQDLDQVPFCLIEFENGDEDAELCCVKEEYHQSLTRILKWYEDTDQFERCQQIVTLMKMIKDE